MINCVVYYAGRLFRIKNIEHVILMVAFQMNEKLLIKTGYTKFWKKVKTYKRYRRHFF